MVVILAYQQTHENYTSNLCRGKLAVAEYNDASQTSQ